MSQDREAFYKKLKESLESTTDFPTEYLYKFIVPTKGNQETEVRSVFEQSAAAISVKASKSGKYNSLSIRLKVSSADAVITYYRNVEKIEGIISL